MAQGSPDIDGINIGVMELWIQRIRSLEMVVLCDFPLPGLLIRSEGRIGTTELSSAILFCLALSISGSSSVCLVLLLGC